ncbi:MAG: glycosyltransferase family 9 protein [Planctomycetes bacterium]|nr:glycosyltransferase family 9 protein [Planctomycetota bacterium]
MVLVTPAIRALSEAYHGSSVSVVTEAFAKDVFEANPMISDIITIDRWKQRGLSWPRKLAMDIGWLKKIRSGMYDIVVDLFCGPRSAQIALFSGAPVRVAEAVRGRSFFYTQTVKVDHVGKHIVEQKMQIVKALTGEVPIPPTEIFLHQEEKEKALRRLHQETGGSEGPFVGFFPGAGWGHKQWPHDRFGKLGDMLTSRGYKVVILGGPRDTEACQRMAENMMSGYVLISGISRLRETISLISQMALFISNDTGPMHISASLGRPTLGLFGPSDVSKYRPWGENAHVISVKIPCSPCPQMKNTCHLHGFIPGECMKRISVYEVYKKVVEILGENS